jgi:putative endonuclease
MLPAFPEVPCRRIVTGVYILASQTRVLYIGITNDLVRRVDAHRRGIVPGFSQKYRVRRLVFYEQTADVRAALTREKQLKGWRRSKKLALIEASNPSWQDHWDSVDVLTMRGG